MNAVPADEAAAAYLLDQGSDTWRAACNYGLSELVVFGDLMTVSASDEAHQWRRLVANGLGLKAVTTG